MKRKPDDGAVSFSLNGGEPVTLSGKDFRELPRLMNGRKTGPMTKAQAKTAELLIAFVRGSQAGK